MLTQATFPKGEGHPQSASLTAPIGYTKKGPVREARVLSLPFRDRVTYSVKFLLLSGSFLNYFVANYEVGDKHLALEVIKLNKNVSNVLAFAKGEGHSVPLAVDSKSGVCKVDVRTCAVLELNVRGTKSTDAVVRFLCAGSGCTAYNIVEGYGKHISCLIGVESEFRPTGVLAIATISGPVLGSGEVESLNCRVVLKSVNEYGGTAFLNEVTISVISLRSGVSLINLLDLASYDSLKSSGLNVLSCDLSGVELAVNVSGNRVTEYKIIELEAGILNRGSTVDVNGSDSTGGDRHRLGKSVNLVTVKVVGESYSVVGVELDLDSNVDPTGPLVFTDLNSLNNFSVVSLNVNSRLSIRGYGSDVKNCEGGLIPTPNAINTSLGVELHLEAVVIVINVNLSGKESYCIVSAGEVIHKLGVANKRYPDLLLSLGSAGIGGLMRINHLILTSLIDVKNVICAVVYNVEVNVIIFVISGSISTVHIITGEVIGCTTSVCTIVNEGIVSVAGSYEAVAGSLCNLAATRASAVLSTGGLVVVSKSGSKDLAAGALLSLGTGSLGNVVILAVKSPVSVNSVAESKVIKIVTGVLHPRVKVDVNAGELVAVGSDLPSAGSELLTVDVIGCVCTVSSLIQGNNYSNVEPLGPSGALFKLNRERKNGLTGAISVPNSYIVTGSNATLGNNRSDVHEVGTDTVGRIPTVRVVEKEGHNVLAVRKVKLKIECKKDHRAISSSEVIKAGLGLGDPKLHLCIRVYSSVNVGYCLKNAVLVGNNLVYATIEACVTATAAANVDAGVRADYGSVQVVSTVEVNALRLDSEGTVTYGTYERSLILNEGMRKSLALGSAAILTGCVSVAGCVGEFVSLRLTYPTARAGSGSGAVGRLGDVMLLTVEEHMYAGGVCEGDVINSDTGALNSGPTVDIYSLNVEGVDGVLTFGISHISGVSAVVYVVYIVVNGNHLCIGKLDEELNVYPLGPTVNNGNCSKRGAVVKTTLDLGLGSALSNCTEVYKVDRAGVPAIPRRCASGLSDRKSEGLSSVVLNTEGNNAECVVLTREAGQCGIGTVVGDPEHMLNASVISRITGINCLVFTILINHNIDTAVVSEGELIVRICSIIVKLVVSNKYLTAAGTGVRKNGIYISSNDLVTERIAFYKAASLTGLSSKTGSICEIVAESLAVYNTASTLLSLGTSSLGDSMRIVVEGVVAVCSIAEYDIVDCKAVILNAVRHSGLHVSGSDMSSSNSHITGEGTNVYTVYKVSEGYGLIGVEIDEESDVDPTVILVKRNGNKILILASRSILTYAASDKNGVIRRDLVDEQCVDRAFTPANEGTNVSSLSEDKLDGSLEVSGLDLEAEYAKCIVFTAEAEEGLRLSNVAGDPELDLIVGSGLGLADEVVVTVFGITVECVGVAGSVGERKSTGTVEVVVLLGNELVTALGTSV